MKCILLLSALFALPAVAADFSINDYNTMLPSWGSTWSPGAGAVNGYYPSFYTGFAPRSQFPERIHVRTARGNQTRVSVILDEQTVADYAFDLVKRYEFYQVAQKGMIDVTPAKAAVLPQLDAFNKVVESDTYGIADFVASAGSQNKEAYYKKGLELIQALNPGRLFQIRLDLNKEFAKWKAQVKEKPSFADAGNLSAKPQDAITAINTLVFGRINYTKKPSQEILNQVADAARLALSDDPGFNAAALDLFRALTGSKYAIQTLVDGHFVDAIQCDAESCFLLYPEFTAIYPTGSVKAFTSDAFGNSIPQFATPGLWQFLSRNYHEMDNIRDEPYYGWAPKMDFEGIGNGFHNPAVRFQGIGASVKKALGIPATHSTLWSVKRGGVSHGCLRLPLGHVWEMRHIFPVENSLMTQLPFFGSTARDFDVYDIDGNGEYELMGVEYLISYDLQGADGLAKREGSNLEIGSADKLAFYKKLYGAKNVFNVDKNGNLQFINPNVSLPSYLDSQKKSVATRIPVKGSIPLYEAAYERDKVQFYLPFTTAGMTQSGAAPLSKRVIRLLGRVRGCAPTTDKNTCGEAAFDKEAAELFKKVR